MCRSKLQVVAELHLTQVRRGRPVIVRKAGTASARVPGRQHLCGMCIMRGCSSHSSRPQQPPYDSRQALTLNMHRKPV